MEDALKKLDGVHPKLGTAYETLRQDLNAAREKLLDVLTWRVSIRGIVENYLLYSTIASLFLGEMMFHKVVDVFRGYPIVVINTFILLLLNRLVIHRNHAIFVGAVMFVSLIASRSSGTPVFSVVAQIIGILVFSIYYFSMLTTYPLSLPRWMALYCRAALAIAVWGIIDFAARKLHIFPETNQTRLHSILPEPSFYVYLTLPAIGIYFNAHLRKGGYLKELGIFLVTYILADSSLGYIGLLFIAFFAFLPRLSVWKMFGFFFLAAGAMVALFFASANFQVRVIDTFLGIALLNLRHVNASTYAVLSNLYVTGMTFIHHPLIGVGIGGYQFQYDNYTSDAALQSDDPDSIGFNMFDASSLFLRATAELGLFGLVFLIGFLVVCARVRGDQHVDIRNALVPFFLLRLGRYGAYFSLDLYFFVGLYVLNYMHYRAQLKPRRLVLEPAHAN